MITFILNPVSGAQLRRPLDLAALAAAHLPPGTEVRIRLTEHAGHATLLARAEAAAGARVVVAVGGDGTVNEVAAGLLGTDTALGIVPRGSGNGLARHLRVPLGAAAAVRHIGTGQISSIDSGRINGRPFFCTAGLGFDGLIAREFAASKVRGLMTYTKLLFTQFPGYQPQPATLWLDDEIGPGRACPNVFVLAFANAAQYGNNAYIAPMADIRDGLLDACLLRHPSWAGALGIAAGMMTRRLPSSPSSTYFKLRKARVQLPAPLPFHCDGEYAGAATIFEIEIAPLSLRVVAN